MKKETRNATPGILHRYIGEKLAVEEKRAAAEGESMRMIRGYAAKFNTETTLGWMTESIAEGAFDDVMGDDVRCLFNHESSMILGRTLSGTCRISVDEIGLVYETDMSGSSPISAHVMDAIARGDVSQSSFAFTIKDEKWEKKKTAAGIEYYHRTILKLERLYDVSPVTYPAYEDTLVEESQRSLEAFITREMPDEMPKMKEIRSRHLKLEIAEAEEEIEDTNEAAKEVWKRKLRLLKAAHSNL